MDDQKLRDAVLALQKIANELTRLRELAEAQWGKPLRR
jgi:hypothetical protein